LDPRRVTADSTRVALRSGHVNAVSTRGIAGQWSVVPTRDSAKSRAGRLVLT